MSLPTLSPAAAKQLIDKGAILIDIRGADEFARERIAGARNQPLDQIEKSGLSEIANGVGPILFHCRTGNRTKIHAARLAAAVDCDAYLVEGGIENWKGAGLAVVSDHRQPIELQRQVQIAAGSLILAGVLLGFAVAPLFFGIAGFVGAGLTFAGISGWCGMARLLASMPWNSRRTAAA